MINNVYTIAHSAALATMSLDEESFIPENIKAANATMKPQKVTMVLSSTSSAKLEKNTFVPFFVRGVVALSDSLSFANALSKLRGTMGENKYDAFDSALVHLL